MVFWWMSVERVELFFLHCFLPSFSPPPLPPPPTPLTRSTGGSTVRQYTHSAVQARAAASASAAARVAARVCVCLRGVRKEGRRRVRAMAHASRAWTAGAVVWGRAGLPARGILFCFGVSREGAPTSPPLSCTPHPPLTTPNAATATAAAATGAPRESSTIAEGGSGCARVRVCFVGASRSAVRASLEVLASWQRAWTAPVSTASAREVVCETKHEIRAGVRSTPGRSFSSVRRFSLPRSALLARLHSDSRAPHTPPPSVPYHTNAARLHPAAAARGVGRCVRARRRRGRGIRGRGQLCAWWWRGDLGQHELGAMWASSTPFACRRGEDTSARGPRKKRTSPLHTVPRRLHLGLLPAAPPGRRQRGPGPGRRPRRAAPPRPGRRRPPRRRPRAAASTSRARACRPPTPPAPSCCSGGAGVGQGTQVREFWGVVVFWGGVRRASER